MSRVFSQINSPLFDFPNSTWEVFEQSISKINTTRLIGGHLITFQLATDNNYYCDKLTIDGKIIMLTVMTSKKDWRVDGGIKNAWLYCDYEHIFINEKPLDINFSFGRILNNGIWYFQYVFNTFDDSKLEEYIFLLPISYSDGKPIKIEDRVIFFIGTYALK